MILVDTSVWIDHFRRANHRLAEVLESGLCHTHEAVLGELCCGDLPARERTLGLLLSLPRVQSATAAEAMWLVDRARLHGLGLGWVDVLLLSSALAADASLWTLDVRLATAADRVGCLSGGPQA